MKLPGFRPGKIPLAIVRQRYGTAVTGEVLEQVVNDATRDLLSERGLRPASQPKVDWCSGLDGQAGADLEFTLELELLPDIAHAGPERAVAHAPAGRAGPGDRGQGAGRHRRRQRGFETIEEVRGAQRAKC